MTQNMKEGERNVIFKQFKNNLFKFDGLRADVSMEELNATHEGINEVVDE